VVGRWQRQVARKSMFYHQTDESTKLTFSSFSRKSKSNSGRQSQGKTLQPKSSPASVGMASALADIENSFAVPGKYSIFS
jgi:hypothetical protein